MKQLILNEFDTKVKKFDLKLQLEKAKRFMFARASVIPPEDSFERDLIKDMHRFYKDINMGAVKDSKTLEAEIRRVGMLMRRENVGSNNKDFLYKASDNFLSHMKSLKKYFVFIVEGSPNVLRDSSTGRFISTKAIEK